MFLQLRIKCSWRPWIIFTRFAISCIPLPIITLIFNKRSILIKIIDAFGYSYPILIRCVAIHITNITLCIIWQRYKKLNQYLERVSDEDYEDFQDKLYATRQDVFIVILATEIHEKLASCVKIFNKFNEIILPVMIFTNYGQSIFQVYFMYSNDFKELDFHEIFMSFVSLTSQIVFTYIMSHFIKEEVNY